MSTTNLIVGKKKQKKSLFKRWKIAHCECVAAVFSLIFPLIYLSTINLSIWKNGLPSSLLKRMANNPLTRHECAFHYIYEFIVWWWELCVCFHKQFNVRCEIGALKLMTVTKWLFLVCLLLLTSMTKRNFLLEKAMQ